MTQTPLVAQFENEALKAFSKDSSRANFGNPSRNQSKEKSTQDAAFSPDASDLNDTNENDETY